MERDRSGQEGSILSYTVDLKSLDRINVTALTFTRFKSNYPDLELQPHCIMETANEAEGADLDIK